MKWKSFFSALGQQAIVLVVNQVLTEKLPPIVHPVVSEKIEADVNNLNSEVARQFFSPLKIPPDEPLTR
jgi:hypothetical protein